MILNQYLMQLRHAQLKQS